MMLMPNSLPVRRMSRSISLASAGVEAGGGLVEQNHDRIVDEGLGELDALLHAGGILFDVAVALLVEADVAEDIGGASPGGDGGDAAHLGHVSRH